MPEKIKILAHPFEWLSDAGRSGWRDLLELLKSWERGMLQILEKQGGAELADLAANQLGELSRELLEVHFRALQGEDGKAIAELRRVSAILEGGNRAPKNIVEKQGYDVVKETGLKSEVDRTADTSAAPKSREASSPTDQPAISTGVDIETHFIQATSEQDWGGILKSLREERGLSLREVARRLDTDATRIREIENKGADLRTGTILRFLEALGGDLQMGVRVQSPKNQRV